MKIPVGIFLNLLFLLVLLKTNEADERSCISTNMTYALCVVNDTDITIISKSFSGELLVQECHEHFIEDVVGESTCHENTTSTKRKVPTTAQRYGFGFLAVFTISVLSLGGLLTFPFIYKVSFQYVLATFTALAIGTLFGDAMFHLIPHTFGLHEHESNGHAHGENHSSLIVPIYQWRMFTAVMVLYGFYLLEVFLHWITDYRHNKNVVHSHGHSHSIQYGDAATNNNSTLTINGNSVHNYNEIDPKLASVGKNYPDHLNMPQISALNEKNDTNQIESTLNNPSKVVNRATGWMIILGDGIHNFADGLAIGAAFNQNLMIGLTTSIAVGCHELPHEFGDYAVLIQSGFTHVRAVLWNFLSATTAFVGFFIGVAVSEDKSARQWIFAVTTGMFIYIALVGLLPSLIPQGTFQIKYFILVNIGFLVGILIMFILAIFEEKLIDLGKGYS